MEYCFATGFVLSISNLHRIVFLLSSGIVSPMVVPRKSTHIFTLPYIRINIMVGWNLSCFPTLLFRHFQRSIWSNSFRIWTILSWFWKCENTSTKKLLSCSTRYSHGIEFNNLLEWSDNSSTYCKSSMIVKIRWRSVRIFGSLSERCFGW